MFKTIVTMLCAMCLFFVSGCGGDTGLEKVHGQVTVDGQPVEGLIVEFEPESGRPATGVTDAEGRYELEFTEHQRGTAAGKYRVRIDFPPGPDAQFRVPARYNTQSELTATVEPGANQHDFQLEKK